MRWRIDENIPMSALSEITAISIMSLRSLPQRLGSSSVVVIGIAAVVAVLVSVLAMSTGLVRTLQVTGPQKRAIVVRTGSSSEIVSLLTNDAVLAIASSAGIKKGIDGRPLISPEGLRIVNLLEKDGSQSSAPLRGFTPDAIAVHPEFKIVTGRLFRPAVAELVVGKSAQRLYKGLDIGAQIILRGITWTVVGSFESGGSARESELIADARTLDSVYRRANHVQSVQSVLVVLESGAAFQTFQDSISTNPRLQVDVATERDFGTQQSVTLGRLLSIIAYVVGGIMAVGAIFGALNTMYCAVSMRSREIATLRAIGFGPVAVVVSVLAEALLLALIGGAIGALIAWLIFNGRAVDTRGGGIAGQLVFDLAVTPALVALGIIWACVIGVGGGLLPAIRVARLPVATALRAV
jgi:putative ABC transport system permease protein